MAKGHLIKRGRYWYVRYYENGRRQWKSLETTRQEIAHAKFSQFILAIEKHEVGWTLKEKSILEFLSEYLSLCEVEHSKKTFRVEKQLLHNFVQFVNVPSLSHVTVNHIEAYKVKRAKEVTKATVNRCLATVKAFFNRAITLGYLEKNPGRLIKKLKEEQHRIKHLSETEVRKLLEVCSPRVRKIVTLFLLTGMRLGELAHLRWIDVDFAHKVINVQNQPDWTTKSYRPRLIPMHPVAEQILKSLPRSEGQTYVIPSRSGRPMESYIRGEVLEYSKKAGIKANIKMFRSTFASNLVMSGVDIYSVAKLLGHHDVKITERHYAHLTPNFLGNTITRLNTTSLLGEESVLL